MYDTQEVTGSNPVWPINENAVDTSVCGVLLARPQLPRRHGHAKTTLLTTSKCPTPLGTNVEPLHVMDRDELGIQKPETLAPAFVDSDIV